MESFSEVNRIPAAAAVIAPSSGPRARQYMLLILLVFALSLAWYSHLIGGGATRRKTLSGGGSTNRSSSVVVSYDTATQQVPSVKATIANETVAPERHDASSPVVTFPSLASQPPNSTTESRTVVPSLTSQSPNSTSESRIPPLTNQSPNSTTESRTVMPSLTSQSPNSTADSRTVSLRKEETAMPLSWTRFPDFVELQNKFLRDQNRSLPPPRLFLRRGLYSSVNRDALRPLNESNRVELHWPGRSAAVTLHALLRIYGATLQTSLFVPMESGGADSALAAPEHPQRPDTFADRWRGRVWASPFHECGRGVYRAVVKVIFDDDAFDDWRSCQWKGYHPVDDLSLNWTVTGTTSAPPVNDAANRRSALTHFPTPEVTTVAGLHDAANRLVYWSTTADGRGVWHPHPPLRTGADSNLVATEQPFMQLHWRTSIEESFSTFDPTVVFPVAAPRPPIGDNASAISALRLPWWSAYLARRLPDLCLIGDSQTRNLGENLVAECIEINNHYPDLALRCHGGRFTFMNFVRISEFPHTLLKECRVTIFNLGQWHFSWAAADRLRLTPEEYGVALTQLIESLDVTLRHRLLWISMTPHPIPWGDHNHCPPVEWRCPHMIFKYHEESMRVMRNLGIATVDALPIRFDVFDLSYDGAHYERFLARGIFVQLATAIRRVLKEEPAANRTVVHVEDWVVNATNRTPVVDAQ